MAQYGLGMEGLSFRTEFKLGGWGLRFEGGAMVMLRITCSL